LENSSPSGTAYRGKLEYTGNAGGANAGDAWTPTAADYPRTGIIDLGDKRNGYGTKRINTGWIPSATSEWVFRGAYDVDMGAKYKMYSIHYLGNNTADIYLGDESTPFPSTPNMAGVAYTPPTTPWMINNYPPSIIGTPPPTETRLETDGDFTGDGSDWSIWDNGNTGEVVYDTANDKVVYTATSNHGIYQTISGLVPGETLTLEISISNFLSGGISIKIDGQDEADVNFTANGVHSTDITIGAAITSSDLKVFGVFGSGVHCDVDYVKVIRK
jgi:hypothetical protein